MKKIVFILVTAILLCAVGTAEAKKVTRKSTTTAQAGTYKGHTYFGKSTVEFIGPNLYGTDYSVGDIQLTFNAAGTRVTVRSWAYVNDKKKVSLGVETFKCYYEDGYVVVVQEGFDDLYYEIQEGAKSLYLENVSHEEVDQEMRIGGTFNLTK